MKNKIKKYIIGIFIVILIIIIGLLGYFLIKKDKETKLVSENLYNKNFYELIDYVQNVETYLAKSTISSSSNHSAETLTYLWREANLAQTYLMGLPIESQELEKTAKFLNQVSDYSYSLSRNCIKGETLSEEDLKNLEELHSYSNDLVSILNQLESDLENGAISWDDLNSNEDEAFSQAVSVGVDAFSSLEENFHEYSGLIYDGAFSEHITNSEPKEIKGDEITEDNAKEIAKKYYGQENVQEINGLGISENTNISAYNFSIKLNNDENCYISISKIGGKIVSSNCNREIANESLTYEQANLKAKEFLEKNNFSNMKETYYLNNSGILTINYAYTQENIVIYPDLIKVKVALDNGEIIGIETSGYLNNHEERDINKDIISIDDAKKSLNKNLDIRSEGLAIIPTEYKTEILCYEFKGKVDEKEFLVYINATTGEEEDILVIYNTPNGVLTM